MSAIISPCGLYRYRLERKLPCRFMTDVGGIFSGKTALEAAIGSELLMLEGAPA